MRVKCLTQEHDIVPQPGLEPGPFNPESSALTIRSPLIINGILIQTEINLKKNGPVFFKFSKCNLILPIHDHFWLFYVSFEFFHSFIITIF